MAEYRSPSGEVLDIPAEGVGAIRALGWEPVKAEPKPVSKPAPSKKKPTTQK